VAELPLAGGAFALLDDEDFANFGGMRWFAHKSPNGKLYAARREVSGNSRIMLYLHREIMGEDASRVGFINGNTLDCRKENLRAAGVLRPSTIDKGAFGEAMVCADLLRRGFEVYIPFTGHTAADLITVAPSRTPTAAASPRRIC
jgi:hypothetical protein